MKKFDLNQHNILAQEYYMDLRQEICSNFARRHVDLKPFEFGDRTQESSKCNMQGHLTVRRALKETKSKQLVQFREFISTFEDCHLHDQAGLFNLLKLSSVLW